MNLKGDSGIVQNNLLDVAEIVVAYQLERTIVCQDRKGVIPGAECVAGKSRRSVRIELPFVYI
jgi:hypothetical protein